jgi:protein phosphatase
VKYAIYTHPGLVRSTNEDIIEAGTIDKVDTAGSPLRLQYMIVCDGMGGMKAGETASKLAALTVIDYIKSMPFWPTLDDDISEQIKNSVSAAHQNIKMLSNYDFEKSGMGTTLVLLIIIKSKAYIIWSGDSRAYLITNRTNISSGIYQNGIHLLTRDHASAWANIASGILTLDQARNHPQANMLTQSIGGSKPPNPEIEILDIYDGDRFMLCTDGVNLHLDSQQITSCMQSNNAPEMVIEKMVAIILSKGAKDNLTIGILDCVDVQYDKPILTTVKPKINNGNFLWLWWFIPLTLIGVLYYFWKPIFRLQETMVIAKKSIQNEIIIDTTTTLLRHRMIETKNKLNIALQQNDSIVKAMIFKAPMTISIDSLQQFQSSTITSISSKDQKKLPIKSHKSKAIEYDAIYYNVKRKWEEIKSTSSEPDMRTQSFLINLELLMDEVKSNKHNNDYTNITKTNWQLEFLNNKFEMIKNRYYNEY